MLYTAFSVYRYARSCYRSHGKGKQMLGKIGLIVVLAAGFALTLRTTAVSATPSVVELTRMYQPKAHGKVDPIARQMGGTLTPKPELTDEQMCSRINEDTPGSCIPTADLVDGLQNDKVDRTTSTVAVHDVTIDFPASMSDRDIHKAIQKNLPSAVKYDIWHAVPSGKERAEVQ